mmetsp:Transcript_9390/g.27115  ORF Transcript_9390/g.27115 Transcript_9390/m.27115 type:complete len:210 (-) Transcript_9390:1455-2084(-)
MVGVEGIVAANNNNEIIEVPAFLREKRHPRLFDVYVEKEDVTAPTTNWWGTERFFYEQQRPKRWRFRERLHNHRPRIRRGGRRCWRCRLTGRHWLIRTRVQNSVRDETLSDSIAHRRGARRDQRRTREHVRRRLAMARVRYRERRGLVGRSRRDSIHVQRSAGSGERVGKIWIAVFENGGREDLPKSIWRTKFGVWKRWPGVQVRVCSG